MSGNPDDAFSWWSAVGPSVTVALAIGGWWIVEQFARAREKRSDLRVLLNAVLASIDRIVLDAQTFYKMDGKDPMAVAQAQIVKKKIQNLGENIRTMRLGGFAIETDEQFKNFRKEITGGAFESIIRMPVPEDAPKMLMIISAAEELKLKIEGEFYRKLVA